MQVNTIAGGCILNNGIRMPYLGLGVCQLKEGKETFDAVSWALEVGYRLIDTASVYKNEKSVGDAVISSGISREELFVTSKVWNADHGYFNTLSAFEKTVKRLQLDYLDLYLIHWPGKSKFLDTWKALEELYIEKRVKAIGVSNCLQHHIEELMESAIVTPMVNQMEFHPHLVQQGLVDFCKAKHIQYQGWGPLMKGEVNKITRLNEIAIKYHKTIPQIVLRWQLQKGVAVIPRSAQKEHIVSNAEIFDFEIGGDDVIAIDALNQNKRMYKHPDQFIF